MTWEASVPFPAEDLGKCRGCGAVIGWIQRVDEQAQKTHPHPVEAKGWRGEKCAPRPPVEKKGRKGLDLDGYAISVRSFPEDTMFRDKEGVVFTSHFATCPERARFWASKKKA